MTFKKRIKETTEFVDDWNWGVMVIEEEKMLKIIEEAKKEFPLDRDTAIFDKDATIKIHLKWSEEVLEWYMKWLGGEIP